MVKLFMYGVNVFGIRSARMSENETFESLRIVGYKDCKKCMSISCNIKFCNYITITPIW